ncbi:MAG: 3-deoxy-7-phosphoheptulonate synthase [Bacteroidetes bacterium]|nr:3-deoxy-7-phosphoheptulonate synthase [Bacteroidota bacterium]
MLLLLDLNTPEERISHIEDRIRELRLTPHRIPGAHRLAIGITGNKSGISDDIFLSMPGVLEVHRISKPFKLVSREMKPDDTIIMVKGVPIGGTHFSLMAGPCSVESRDQIMRTAERVAEDGAQFLRGGAFKPRSSPYSFQGLKQEGLKLIRQAADEFGLRVVTELMNPDHFEEVEHHADIIQIGARNMQNFSMLEMLGRSRRPILLKRGLSATIEEWLLSAEYIMANGNPNVILCERGIRTFETYTRNTLDLNAIPVIKKLSHLPILVDPSHGIGLWDGVAAMARAGVAAGADGLIIEVHPDPETALSDGPQSLKFKTFSALAGQLRQLVPLLGKDWPERDRA